ncbi:MAG: hypothetical protein AB1659_07905 [Thermodesulfobacteriota bacterium]
MIVKLELTGRSHKSESAVFKANHKVYAILTCCGFEPGRYEFDFHWINPQGKIKHRILRDLEIPRKMADHECKKLGVWLKISRGFFGFIDHHSIGEWKLKVLDHRGNAIVKPFLIIP